MALHWLRPPRPAWKRATGWFVDSVNGNDASSGASWNAPVKTIARLYQVGVQAGANVWIRYGSYFRETLHIASGGLPNGVNVAAYGPRVAAPVDDLGRPLLDHAGNPDDRPRFDGADVIPATSWTKTAGRTNVYQATVNTAVVFYGWSGMGNRVWESWVGPGFGSTGRLLYVADVATCDATPGSWTGPTRPTHGNDTIYVHATDSSNPATSGKVYELPMRPWGVNAGQYPTDATKMASVRGVSVVRHGHHDGGLLTATYVADFLVDSGGAGPADPSHGLWNNGTAEDGVASSVISYGNNLPPTVVRRVRAMCTSPLQGVTTVNGFYSHTDGAAGHEHERKTYEDVMGPTAGSGFTCSNLIAVGSVLQTTIIRPRAGENTVMTLATINGPGRVDIVDPLHVRYGFGHGSIRSIVLQSSVEAHVWGGRIVLDAAAPYAALSVETGASLTVEGASVVFVGNEPGYRYPLASIVTGGTLSVNHSLFANAAMPINANAATAGTINFNLYDSMSNSWKYAGAESTTFAAWQGRGYDAGGARQAITFVGDPTTGNTRPAAASAAWTVGAGADAYGDAHLAEWIAAIP